MFINDSKLSERAEVLRDNGTNKASFLRGEIDRYDWVDVGSTFVPSELNAAFLLAQLNEVRTIQEKRLHIWQHYEKGFASLIQERIVEGPGIPTYASNNAHMFYLVCQSQKQRDSLISFLRQNGIQAVFHYQALHNSPYYSGDQKGEKLDEAEKYTTRLVRLPLHLSLTMNDVDKVIERINGFFGQ